MDFFRGISWRSGFADHHDIHLPERILFGKGKYKYKN
jgi:hypothetical protein